MPPQRRIGPGPETEFTEQPLYAGHYRLEEPLGSGGMGVVHLARSASGLRLAVKVVHPELAEDREFRGRFRQEVAAARRVSGAFTAPVVDADPHAEQPWMATLYIPGPTLEDHVKRNGALPPDRLRRLLAGLAEALRDIHRVGVVHRDLKPSNVLLAEDGPKVIDFGISRPADSELHTETGKLIGTPPFMAPEQFRRPREVGPAADVFALGSVLVHAATGRGPFDSDSPYVVAYQVVHDEPDLAGVPDDLAGLVARCLAKEPRDRPTPDELMGELRAISASYETQVFAPYGSRSQGVRPYDSAGGPTGDGARLAGARAFIPAQRDEGDGRHDERHEPALTHVSDRRSGGGRGRPRLGRSRLGRSRLGRSRLGRSRSDRPPRSVWSRRTRLVVCVLAVAVAAGVTASFTVLGVGEPADRTGAGAAPPKAPDPKAPEATSPTRAWSTFLRPSGARPASGGTPHCVRTAAPKAGAGTPKAGAGARLYCAAPGISAAAVDAETGKVRWSRPAPTKAPSLDAPAAPVLSGGLVQTVTDAGGVLKALDPDTGRTRWSRDLEAYAGRVAHARDTVLLMTARGTLRGLDARDGSVRWQRSYPGLQDATLWAGDDGRVHSVSARGTGSLVTALDPRTGSQLWQRHLEGSLTPVGARDGTVWFQETDRDSYTVAVVRYDATRRAVRRVPLDVPLPDAVASLHRGTVHLLGAGGGLVAVDTEGADAGQRWRLETSVSQGSAPTVAGSTVYFGAADGRLIAVDVRDRRPALLGQTDPRPSGRTGALASALGRPSAGDGRVFATAPDGSVFSLPSRSPQQW
ncbi:Serine/threonine-protein kinase AfsK [Streptomyces sp. YIM 130001]|uniref:serine/threonine-protein kinase n=1 Tax=Streptomyces sp. YIM 130001 TaxID=2259644 RepID=UPI000E647C3A|nr:serine/threonine-protein kinase [Streptomyces sp. YIM 130001]RII12509.1 Serine/threonine-protein kinase AfsK [Streptomyces sp. YIM 130001]